MSSLSKDETLRILASFGVHYPENTKFAMEILTEKLARAIDMAQRVDVRNVPKCIDPGSLTKWKRGDEESTKALLAYRELSMEEGGAAILRKMVTGGNGAPPLYINAFSDMRPVKSKLFLVEVAEKSHSITLRVIEIRILEKQTPLICILYGHGPGPGAVRARAFLMKRASPVTAITATILEQKLLLRVLEHNSARLDPSFKPARHFSEVSYTCSFLIPLLPLTMENIGSLTKTCCSRCGAPAASRCAACQSAAYCGKECQTSDWAEHKKLCKPLSKGVWQIARLTLPRMPPEKDGASYYYINKYDSMNSMFRRKMPDADQGPPPNVHGSNPFIVKIQIPLLKKEKGVMKQDIGGGMMVYDRRRTFICYIYPDTDPAAYARFTALVHTRGIMGYKVYRWAKMVADWTLNVCVDIEPNEPVQW